MKTYQELQVMLAQGLNKEVAGIMLVQGLDYVYDADTQTRGIEIDLDDKAYFVDSKQGQRSLIN